MQFIVILYENFGFWVLRVFSERPVIQTVIWVTGFFLSLVVLPDFLDPIFPSFITFMIANLLWGATFGMLYLGFCVFYGLPRLLKGEEVIPQQYRQLIERITVTGTITFLTLLFSWIFYNNPIF